MTVRTERLAKIRAVGRAGWVKSDVEFLLEELAARDLVIEALLKLPTVRKAEVVGESPRKVIDAVERIFGLDRGSLVGRDRHASCSRPRHIAILLCRERLRLSFPEIGREFGNRDHTSAMSAYKRAKLILANDVWLAEKTKRIEAELDRASKPSDPPPAETFAETG